MESGTNKLRGRLNRAYKTILYFYYGRRLHEMRLYFIMLSLEGRKNIV